MFKTVKNKFIILSVLFIVGTVTIPIVFLILQFNKNFDQRSSVMLESTLDILKSGIESGMLNADHSNVQAMIEGISKNESLEHIRIFNSEGRILYASNPDEVGKVVNVISPRHVNMDSTWLANLEIVRLPNQKGFSITEPIINRDNCQSCHGTEKNLGYLDVDINLTNAEINFYTGSIHLVFLAIAIIIVMFVGSYFLFNYFISKPLGLFFTAIDNVEKGDLSVRLPVEKEDEFSILQSHFNKMVARLQSSNEKIEELHIEQLQHTDKLVTLGELTIEMAHEINNHAAIILSRTDFMKLDSKNNSALMKYIEDLDVIINQIGKVSKITHNILKHGKKRVENFLRIDLVQIVDDSLQILEPILLKRGIEFTKKYEFGDSLIFGDPFQIEQLVTNLAINAMDAMDTDGELKVTIKRNKNNKPMLIISDNGQGIAQKEMKQMFLPFYTTKSPYKGTGLGLYIVKNICENHNATIECESEPGKGTSFIITFNGDV